AGAGADRELLVVQQQGQAAFARGLAKRGQAGQGLGFGGGAQQAHGRGLVANGSVAGLVHRLAGVDSGLGQGRQPGPLVDLGGGVEAVGRSGKGEAGAAGVFAHDHRPARPFQGRARANDPLLPAFEQGDGHRRAHAGLQRRARLGEIQAGAGQPARIVEGRRRGGGHGGGQSLSSSGTNTSPRSSRTSPSSSNSGSSAATVRSGGS